ncbi:MAG: hypothetical protein K0Q60_421 [Microvirga sp.]|nr:hypothetical protein [Microvirga sp.]
MIVEGAAMKTSQPCARAVLVSSLKRGKSRGIRAWSTLSCITCRQVVY